MKSETIGWAMSVSLHVGVAVVALVGLPDFSVDRPSPPAPIAVEFVKIGEKTQVVAPEPEKTPQEQAPSSRQQPNYAREEVAANAPSDAVPLPDAKPEREVLKPKPKPKPEVTERQRLVARVRPNSKPKPPSRLKSSRIAALIDRSMKEEQEQAPQDEEEKEEKVEQKEEAKPDLLAGIRGRMAMASLQDALSNKMSSCWTFPTGAKGVQDMNVKLRIWVGSGGELLRPPEYVDVGNLNDPDRAFFRVFAESARRAVQLCAPYPEAVEFLQQTNTQSIIFNFDPKEFLGG